MSKYPKCRSGRLHFTLAIFVGFACTADNCFANPSAVDGTVTAAELINMSPPDIGRLAGAGDSQWVAKTVYPAVPLGGGVSAIVLFGRPETILRNICTVRAQTVMFTPTQLTSGLPDSATPYRVGRQTQDSYFAVAAAPSGAMSGSPDAAADACHKTAISPDFMARNGADNLFSAASPELANDGANVFESAVALAHDDSRALSFSLECNSPIKAACNNARSALGVLNPRDFESVSLCSTSGDDCIRIEKFNDHFDWTIDIHLLNANSHRIKAVKITSVPEPVI